MFCSIRFNVSQPRLWAGHHGRASRPLQSPMEKMPFSYDLKIGHELYGRSCRASGAFAPEVLTQVFTTFNTALLFPWTLMIVAPQAKFTQFIVEKNIFLYLFCAAYIYGFASATAQSIASGNNLADEVQYLFLEAVADPDKMASMFSRPAYAAQDWIHLCTWDYFVGQWVYEQGLKKQVPTQLSLLAVFTTGPIGLILHWITELGFTAVRSQFQEEQTAESVEDTK